ncbi:MAG: hypothetical protein AAFN10_19780 [Bacteroidota bacterium]
MFTLIQILLYSSRDERSAKSDNHDSRFAERLGPANPIRFLMVGLVIVIGGLMSLGWLSESGGIIEENVFQRAELGIVMRADTDTVKVFFPDLDFDILLDYATAF